MRPFVRAVSWGAVQTPHEDATVAHSPSTFRLLAFPIES